MARINLWETVVNGSGLPISGASVDVWLARTTTDATIFADEVGGGTLANPVTTTNGNIPGWVEEGEYDLHVTGVGITETTKRINLVLGGNPAKAANSITSTEIGADQVGTSEIAPGAVTSDELAADSVIAGKIAAGAVSQSTDFAAGVVDAAAIGADQVGTSEIAPDAVTAAEIAPNAVGNSEMADNAIGNAEMADNAIGSEELTDALAEKLGVNEASGTRRGLSSVATLENTTSASFVELTTPNSVTVDVPGVNTSVVRLFVQVTSRMNGGGSCQVDIQEDGVSLTGGNGILSMGSATLATFRGVPSSSYSTSPAADTLGGWFATQATAGSHTYRLVFRRSGGTSADFSNRRLMVVVEAV